MFTVLVAPNLDVKDMELPEIQGSSPESHRASIGRLLILLMLMWTHDRSWRQARPDLSVEGRGDEAVISDVEDLNDHEAVADELSVHCLRAANAGGARALHGPNNGLARLHEHRPGWARHYRTVAAVPGNLGDGFTGQPLRGNQQNLRPLHLTR